MADKLVKKNDIKDKLFTQKDATELEESLVTIALLEKQIADAKVMNKADKAGNSSRIDKEDIKNLQKECKEEKKKAARLEVELAEQTASREKLQLELDSIKSKLASLDPNNIPTGIRPHEQAAIDALDAKVELKSRELKASNEKILTLERSIKTLDQQHTTLLKEKERLRLEMVKGSDEVEKLRQELKVEEQKAKGAEVWQKNLKEAFRERDQAVEDLKKAKEEEAKLKLELEGKGDELSGAVKDAEAKIDASIARMEKEIKEKEAEIKRLKSELDGINKENDKASADLKSKTTEIEALKKSAGITSNRGEMKSMQLVEAEEKVVKLQRELEEVQSNIAKITQSNQELLDKGEEIKSQTNNINTSSTPASNNNDLSASLAHSKSTLAALEQELLKLQEGNERLRTSIAEKERELAAGTLATPPGSPESRLRMMSNEDLGMTKEDERDLEEAKEEARRNRERVESLEARLKELEGAERFEEERSEAASSFPSRPPSTLGNTSRISNSNFSQRSNPNEKYVVEKLVKSIKILSEDTARLRGENRIDV